jgi:hypothetical protein
MTEASEDVSTYRYPVNKLVPDYIRSVAGLGVLGVPAVYSIGTHWIITSIMGGLILLFGTFGVSTAIRQFSIVLLDRHGLRVKGPRPAELLWSDVTNIDLRFFSTRRDRVGGWFQLKVRGGRNLIKIDSNLDDFDGLLQQVAAAIARHDLPVSPIGRENFSAAGFDVPAVAEDSRTEGPTS